MSIHKTLQSDNIAALKARDSQKRSALSFIVSELNKNAKDAKLDLLSDDSAIQVLRKQLKQRKETLESATMANRLDLSEQTKFEMEIISSYLPKAMPEDEMRNLAQKIVSELGATSVKDMGKCMSKFSVDYPGADKAQLSVILKAILGK